MQPNISNPLQELQNFQNKLFLINDMNIWKHYKIKAKIVNSK
jgi:hypothetical protein